MADTTTATSINAKLGLINTSFFHSSVRSKVTGDGVVFPSTNPVTSATLPTTLYTRAYDAPSYTKSTTASDLPANNITEVNFNDQYVAVNTPLASLLTGFSLDKLRITGSIAGQFDTYQGSTTANPIKALNYQLTSSATPIKSNQVSVNSASSSTDTGFDFTKLIGDSDEASLAREQTDMFILERMTVFWERYYTLMFSLKAAATANANSVFTTENRQTKLLNLLFSQISWENTVAEKIPSISSGAAKFNNNVMDISRLTTNLKKNRVQLNDNISALSGQKASTRTSGYIEYVAMALLIAVFIAVIVIFSVPMERAQKLPIATGLFVISILLVIIIYYIRGIGASSVEGFAVGTVIGVDASAIDITNKTVGLTTEALYFSAILVELEKYLARTIDLGLKLQVNRGYKNINYTMNKEVNYYTDKEDQLLNTSDKLFSTARIVNLDYKTSQARINFYISTILIIAAGTILAVLTENSPRLLTTVVTLTILLLIVALFIYIFEVTSRVRTDGSKVYWGKPNMRRS